MKYLNYPTKKETPQRLTRKGARSKVFLTNKKMNKIIRKARRLANRDLDSLS